MTITRSSQLVSRVLVIAYIALLLSVSSRAQATYYIDYVNGNNANSGLTKSAPWKTHPWMQSASACTGTGSAPTYTHSAGDTFVFKMGVTWPNACFPIQVLFGGSAGNVDTWTFDPTWGTAFGTTLNGASIGTYTFSAGGGPITGVLSCEVGAPYNAFVFLCSTNVKYVAINGLEMTGMAINAGSPSAVGINLYQSSYITISNCYFHNYMHSGVTSDTQMAIYGYGTGADNVSYNVQSRVTNCLFDGSGASDSGEAINQIPIVDHNVVRNMTNGILPGGDTTLFVHDNVIGPINVSFDPSAHENCMELFASSTTAYVWNNILHDCTAMALGNQEAGGQEIDYWWNNVIYPGGVSAPPIPIQLLNFGSQAQNAGSEAHVWNNTVVNPNGICARTVDYGRGNYRTIDLQNNHCISNAAGFVSLAFSANTVINRSNITETVSQATTDGYVLGNNYAPVGTSGAAYRAGPSLASSCTGNLAPLCTDLLGDTRPTSGNWDAGAYYLTPRVLQTVGRNYCYGTSCVVPISATSAGSKLLVYIATRGIAGMSTPIAAGVTFSCDLNNVGLNWSNMGVSICSAANVSAGVTSITARYTSTVDAGVIVQEVAGGSLINIFDQGTKLSYDCNATLLASGCPSSGLVTTHGYEFLVALVVTPNKLTGTNGWTALNSVCSGICLAGEGYDVVVLHKIVTTTGTYSATATGGDANNYSIMAAYQ